MEVKKMRMVDLSSATGSVEIADRPIVLNCESKAGKKALAFIRALVMPLMPCCGRLGMRPSAVQSIYDDDDYYHGSYGSAAALGHTVTGTIYGSRKGRVTFCLQEDPKGPPLLLLEFAIPTCTLVSYMSSGMLRIALECEKSGLPRSNPLTVDRSGRRDGGWAKSPKSPDLLMEPVWSLFCNGRKVGYAIRRLSSEADRRILSLMQSVSMGAGVMPSPEPCSKKRMMMSPAEELMYMRARYERVGNRSHDSLSLHLINPDGTSGQELSISLYRS